MRYGAQVTVEMDPTMRQQIEDGARKWGLSMSQYARTLIAKALTTELLAREISQPVKPFRCHDWPTMPEKDWRWE